MSHTTLWPLLLAGAAFLAQPLSAQSWLQFAPEFKIQSGLSTGALTKDRDDNQVFGFAVANAFKLDNGSSFSVELGYSVLPGATPERLRTSGTVYYNANGTVYSADPKTKAPLFLRVNDSTDTRSHKMDGFSLRGAYISPIASVKGLSWQAGLSLDRFKTINEFIIDLRPMYLDANGGAHSMTSYDGFDATGTQITAHEGYANSVTSTQLTVGVQAGLIYQLNKDFKVEGTLRNVGYGAKDYTPLAYSGKPGTLSDKNGRGFIFEVGLSLTL
jgi:hypothetical protein